MKRVASTAFVLVCLLVLPVSGALGDEARSPSEQWVRNVLSVMLRDGYRGILEKILLESHISKSESDLFISKIKELSNDGGMISYDIIQNAIFGSTMNRIVAISYYPGKREIAWLFEFRRPEDNWELWGFRASDSPYSYLINVN